jgi:F0F1-type ATP synthase membrane subunit c/vacuolar-type H+-ATPase subunit K
MANINPTRVKPDPRKPWKAVGAGITAAAGTFATALADGHIDGAEVTGIIVATVAATLAVYGIKNPTVSW